MMAQPNLSPPSSRPKTSSYSHRANLPTQNDSFTSPVSNDPDSSDSSDESPLPFPAALPRADFLAPSFDAAAYLSALHTGGPGARHQTLEDLRAELRDRSAAISAELLDLVNANYGAFLGLGDELRGGDERVEDVRVALLGFRRAVEELQGRVRERRAEVGRLNGELLGVKGAVELGRRMLELEERLRALEARLAVGRLGARPLRGPDGRGEEDGEEEDDEWGDEDDLAGGSDDDEEDEEEGDAGFVSSRPGKLASLAREYVTVEAIAESIGRHLPFVKKMEERISRCRNTILLDLSTGLKEARKAGSKGQGRILKFLGIYRVLDAQADAVRVLKEK